MMRRALCLFLFPASLCGVAAAQPAASSPCPAIVATRPTIVPPQRYRAGDLVPAFAMDEPLHWVECTPPDFPPGANRQGKWTTFLSITVDEKGAVVDIKPRGNVDPQGYFDAAVAAVRKWKSSAPHWKTLPVRCSFAADIVFDATAPAPATAAVQSSPASADVPTPAPAMEKPAAPATAPPSPAVTAQPPAEKPAAAPPVAPAASEKEEAKPAPTPEPVATQVVTQNVTQPAIAAPPPATTPASPPAPEPKPAITAPASVAAPVRGETMPSPAAPPPAATAAPAAEEKLVEPARTCPQFFVLPESEQSRRSYRAGELVPNAYLDQKPAWVQCPSPDFSGMAARTAAVIVVIDDKGAVRDVRPRGQPANAAFQRARAALTGWRIAPPPRYKTLPVWTSTALDIRNEGTPPATTPVALPGAAAPATRPAEIAQGASSSEAPFIEEFYYKAKWGFADEFWRLFLKNHWPILRKHMETGRILEVRAEKPLYHATEDGRWDYRVTIVYRSAAARFATVDTAALERQLFPDQETFHREEQRRFEVLLAHWDVPIEPVKLEK